MSILSAARARFWRACWVACTHSLWMETAAAASHRSSFRRIASALPTPPLQRDPTPLLLACARAAREHPTISFRPVVRPVRPLSCPPNHTALKPSCGEIGAARRLSARCYESPIRVRLPLGSPERLRPQDHSSGQPSTDAAAVQSRAHHGSLRNHGQGARLHSRVNHARPRALTCQPTTALR